MLEYLGQMSIFEIYGFGKIVGAQENDDFQEYLTNILVGYVDSSRKMKRELIKLAESVVKEKKEKEKNQNV